MALFSLHILSVRLQTAAAFDFDLQDRPNIFLATDDEDVRKAFQQA
jgi:hypothetical protein